MMKIRRVLPDFLSQTGDARVTLNLKDFPNDTAASSSLGPFTVNSSTQKIDTRARARSISLKVSNTSTSQFWKLGTFRIDIQPDGRR
jgi:cyclophilin family peptidyl-prolyl cis-trans isomerase